MHRYGLTWLSKDALGLISKSLAPDFIFIPADMFISSNASYRFGKRTISCMVSVLAPLALHAQLNSKQISMSTFPEQAELEGLLRQIRESIRLSAKSGADAIVIVDTINSSDVISLSPVHVVERLLPLYEDLVSFIHQQGLPAIFSAEGDTREYYSGLKSVGFDGVHLTQSSLDDVLKSLEYAKEHDLQVFGGITHHILEEVELASYITALKQILCEYPNLAVCDTGKLTTLRQAQQAVQILQEIK